MTMGRQRDKEAEEQSTTTTTNTNNEPVDWTLPLWAVLCCLCVVGVVGGIVGGAAVSSSQENVRLYGTLANWTLVDCTVTRLQLMRSKARCDGCRRGSPHARWAFEVELAKANLTVGAMRNFGETTRDSWPFNVNIDVAGVEVGEVRQCAVHNGVPHSELRSFDNLKSQDAKYIDSYVIRFFALLDASPDVFFTDESVATATICQIVFWCVGLCMCVLLTLSLCRTCATERAKRVKQARALDSLTTNANDQTVPPGWIPVAVGQGDENQQRGQEYNSFAESDHDVKVEVAHESESKCDDAVENDNRMENEI